MNISKVKFIFLLMGISALTITFQNCSRGHSNPSENSSSEKTTTASMESESISTAGTGSKEQIATSASQSSTPKQLPANQERQPATSPRADKEPPSPSGTTPAPKVPPAPISTTVNIVAGDSKSCGLAVADFIRTKLSSGVMSVVAPSCKIGGGCGVSCGKPNGTSCVSANPNSYGACLIPSDIDSYVVYNMQAYTNRIGFSFVATNQTDCNTRIQDRHRYATGSNTVSNPSCKIGGGCGVSCGKPNGTSCVSANPNVMGACFEYDEFKNL
jgi:hypothetical protein